MWEFAIDTGGTFTDCLGLAPDGTRFRSKVLSNGTLRFTGRHAGRRCLVLKKAGAFAAGQFRGYQLETFGEQTARVLEHRKDGKDCLVYLDTDLPESPSSRVVTLKTGEAAPVLAIRLATATPAGEKLPPYRLRLGTTRGTNALLEEKGAPPLLFVTRGFKDLLRIGDQRRPHLFALDNRKPEPLPAAVIEVDERLDATGAVLKPLGVETVLRAAEPWLGRGVKTAAVALMHSFRNPSHEEELEIALRKLGFSYVSSSARLSPFIKYLTRMETAVVDAYLGPVMVDYLNAVEAGQGAESELLLMTSAGGLVSRNHFHPKDSLLSGPAGGVVGVAASGRRAGEHRLLALDMGGTSTDVSRYDGGLDTLMEHRVGRARLAASALRIETVAAGGGSLCGFEAGRLFVGPESAGAHPGPACYGNGGPLTLTDVNLLLDRLDAGRFGIPIDRQAAEAALDALLERVNRDREAPMAAETLLHGFLEIANERMAQAMGKISVREGFDPADFTLVAFGGAGGLHACALAEKLGIRKILFPPEAGLLSAYGLQEASREVEEGEQVLELLDACREGLSGRFSRLVDAARGRLLADLGTPALPETELQREVGLRLKGQDSELFLEFRGAETLDSDFEDRFRSLFGYFPEGRAIEVSRMRIRLSTRARDPDVEDFRAEEPEAHADTGRVIFDPFSTLWVAPGWQLSRGSQGSRMLNNRGAAQGDWALGETGMPKQDEAVVRELLTQRFRSVVEEMGEQLQRTALSVNIKERLDFSCALLDAEGRLVVNAPHIPVHLGALGLCVRAVTRKGRLEPGDVVVVNHPAFGGSHLPDVTLIAPLYEDPRAAELRLLGYLANRAHHAEIGGVRPGSMPPSARSLGEEGVILPPTWLYRRGEARWDTVREILSGHRYPSRQVDENLADLQGQVASIRKGIERFGKLLETWGASRLEQHMVELREMARRQVFGPLSDAVRHPRRARLTLDDGTPLAVSLERKGDGVTVDFSGSGSVHPGNTNANPAIVHSVLLYVLRILAGEARDLPLNEGFLEGVEIKIPRGCLNPEFPDDPFSAPAVVGGNVEVSQRLTDLLLEALGLSAHSQGTMNNVLYGNAAFSFYETLGGGGGAGPGFHGSSGMHVHMSNTAVTDPEILETRFPVRLERFAIRAGSGGAGRFKGGDGLVREIRFLEPLSLSILAQQRRQAPAGMEGGAPGLPGRQHLIRGKQTLPLDGDTELEVEAGDLLQMETPGGGGWGKG